MREHWNVFKFDGLFFKIFEWNLAEVKNSDLNSVGIGSPVGKAVGFRYCKKASHNYFILLLKDVDTLFKDRFLLHT